MIWNARTFDIGSSTALLTIFVCFHGSEKSGSEKNHFNTKWSLTRKYPYSPHRRDWNFQGDGGFCKAKNLKKCVKLYWNLQRGGVLEKRPSVGEVLIFSGVTRRLLIWITNL